MTVSGQFSGFPAATHCVGTCEEDQSSYRDNKISLHTQL